MLRLASFALAFAFAIPSAATPGGQDRPIRAGVWDLAIVFGGGDLEATLDISYRGDTITAALKLGDHDSPVRAGKQTGSKLTLEPTSPSMDVRYELEFSADEVKGSFTYQGETGQLTGKRRRTTR